MPKKKKDNKKYVKFIWHYLKPYKKLAVFLILLAVIVALIDSFIPYFMGVLVDVALGRKDFWGLGFLQIVLIWIVLVVAYITLNRTKEYYNMKLSVTLEKDYTVNFCKHAINLPMEFHNNQKPGETIKIIDRTGSALHMIVGIIVDSFLPNLLVLIFSLIIMFTLSWMLALILFVSVIVFFLTSYYYMMSKILKSQRMVNQEYNKITGDIGDIFANAFAVKTNTREKYEIAGISKKYDAVNKNVLVQMIMWIKYGVAQAVNTRFTFLAVTAIAVYLVSQGQITEGVLIIFISYIGRIGGPLWSITNNIRYFRRSLVDLEDSIRIEDKQAEQENKNAQPAEIKGGLEFKNVYFSYPQRNQGILSNFSFKVTAGQTLAIFGATGSGKTTAYNLICRLYDPDKGKIFFDDIDSDLITRESIREQIAVVPQSPILFNNTIWHNIKYGNAKASEQDVIKAAKIANAHEFISKLSKGYQTRVGERGVKLSGGQVQRIAIARAAIQDPKILILDEATSSLDQKTKFEVLDALNKLIAGRTTIIITHDFSAITQSADQIIVLDNGKIVQSGNHQQLLRQKGPYKSLWQTQQKHLQ